MALRRPPTRIELKPDDIEEFEKFRKEESAQFFQMGEKSVISGGFRFAAAAEQRTDEAKRMAAMARIGLNPSLDLTQRYSGN